MFAYDLVPSPSVIVAALKAARRVHDFPTAVRIFEGTCVRLRCLGIFLSCLSEGNNAPCPLLLCQRRS